MAIFYMSLFPQFIKPDNGSVITQSIMLGMTQLRITVNFLIVMTAGTVSTFFKNNPRWLRLQKWVMGLTLGGLAVRLVPLA
ncbi:MAG: hypothetical protein E6J90_16575 [Deltaproteobacteria bacterium]|nr:MAG: hypothetical protein E6J90_16575 [Deltaproteobacteria bacterium]